MDGLTPDEDVLFLMTTNRPDVLESALAERPGRVDFALKVGEPDAEGRRRLFELYGRGAAAGLSQLDHFVARTEGVSAAFIRELMRRAALLAADAGAPQPNDAHVSEALEELLAQVHELHEAVTATRNAHAEEADACAPEPEPPA